MTSRPQIPRSGIDRLRQALAEGAEIVETIEHGRPRRLLAGAAYAPRLRTIEHAIRIGAVVPGDRGLVDGFAQSWRLPEDDSDE